MTDPRMRTIHEVRKRDGRLVDFDESKIADAIYKAALSVGGEDRFLAEELASVVALFLEKAFSGRVPSIEDVQDMVEKVLIETGHARTAKAFILYREKRAKIREAESAPRRPAQRELFGPGPVTVLAPLEGRTRPLDEAALAEKLVAETEVAPEAAAEVARAAAERIRGLDRAAVDDVLVSRVIDAELLSRGLFAAVERRRTAALDFDRIRHGLFPKAAERRGTPAARVGGRILAQYALREVIPPAATAAHLAGRIHVAGLDEPTAVFAAAVSPDATAAGAGRDAVPRRFIAVLGAALRRLSPHVFAGMSLVRANVLLAPRLAGLDYDALQEEAWHLLVELSGIRGLEIEATIGPPPLLASRVARGAEGQPPAKYSAFAGTAVQTAAALFDAARALPEGLSGDRPRIVAVLGPDAFEEGSRAILDRTIRHAVDRGSMIFVLDRDDLPLVGPSAGRVRLEDASRLTDPAAFGAVIGARAVVNLPRAAARAGEGDVAGFLAEVEEATGLAAAAVAARRRFLARAAAGPDGPLHPFAGRRGGGPAMLDVDRALDSVAAAGLNEAVAAVLGEELHESDEAVKLGQRVLASARAVLAAARAPDCPLDLDAEEDPEVLARLHARDREETPRAAARFAGYTPGVAMRPDAPVDLAVRLEAEGRLHAGVRSATVRVLLAGDEPPPPETVAALLRKTFRNTRIRQVELVRPGGEGRG